MYLTSVMNYKKHKPRRNNKNKDYMSVWSFKRSFKLDYIQSKEFKKALKNRTI